MLRKCYSGSSIKSSLVYTPVPKTAVFLARHLSYGSRYPLHAPHSLALVTWPSQESLTLQTVKILSRPALRQPFQSHTTGVGPVCKSGSRSSVPCTRAYALVSGHQSIKICCSMQQPSTIAPGRQWCSCLGACLTWRHAWRGGPRPVPCWQPASLKDGRRTIAHGSRLPVGGQRGCFVLPDGMPLATQLPTPYRSSFCLC